MSPADSRLFKPIRVGSINLSHRIVMGPLCSNLANDEHVLEPSAAAKYYGSRAREPGTMIIGEATFVSARAGGITEARAGIWTEDQIDGWKRAVEGVHKAGSYIFLQLWAVGRSADPAVKLRDGTGDVVSSSAVPETEEGGHIPRAMREDEIQEYITDYAAATRNAVEAAGFDGVELHGGNGSLIDQFTQNVVNRRTDSWGGNVQSRSRFALEITKAVCEAVGPSRVGFRISPWSTYGGMGMNKEDTISQFKDLLTRLKELGIAYVYLVESRIAGGFGPKSAADALNREYRDKDVLIAFGRAFVTNLDLIDKIRKNKKLNN
ncbi:NADP-dependent oxidoreductase lnbE [Pseudocercospora fuligena]|uniref:NADP-dependent oxidoreductase lnbE n=1 Tax=Pseudocercospora fuligena TaxID=685502 RepID=A0A8H6REH4_9PEZI|nr:NADP-dependent oxidoreductase lnbE [Pseudocercospora fuligena]